MRGRKRVWVADQCDLAIIGRLAGAGDHGCRIDWGELATDLGIRITQLETRLRLLLRYGYVRRAGRGRYAAVRVPAPGVEHVIRTYAPGGRSVFSLDPGQARAAADRYEQGASIRAIAEEFGAAQDTVWRALAGEGVELRPRGFNGRGR